MQGFLGSPIAYQITFWAQAGHPEKTSPFHLERKNHKNELGQLNLEL